MQAQLQEMAAEIKELVGDGASERRKEVLLCQMRALRAELDATAVHCALPVLLAAFEPTLVRDVVLGLWSGLTLSVAAASSAAARSLGIGVSIGEVRHAARPRPCVPSPLPDQRTQRSASSHVASPPISGRPHTLTSRLPTPCRLDRHCDGIFIPIAHGPLALSIRLEGWIKPRIGFHHGLALQSFARNISSVGNDADHQKLLGRNGL